MPNLPVSQGVPDEPGMYVVYLQARQSGESDNLIQLLEYRFEKRKFGNEQLLKVGSGFFVFEPDDKYYCAMWIYGWIGPISSEFPFLPKQLDPLNLWKVEPNG